MTLTFFFATNHPFPPREKHAEMTNPNLLEVGGRIHEIQQLKKVHEGNAVVIKIVLLLLSFVLLDVWLLLPGFLRKITFSQVDGEVSLYIPSRCLRSLPVPQLICTSQTEIKRGPFCVASLPIGSMYGVLYLPIFIYHKNQPFM